MAATAVERRRSATRERQPASPGERSRRRPAGATGPAARPVPVRRTRVSRQRPAAKQTPQVTAAALTRRAAPRRPAARALATATRPGTSAAPIVRTGTRTLESAAITAYRLAAGIGLTVLLIAGAASLTVALALHVLGFTDLTVVSPSMSPAIPEGSLVLARPVDASRIRVGDVISFHPPSDPAIIVTHRVAGREMDSHPSLFITKGDANPAPDGWRVPAQGKVAKVMAVFPRLGYVVVLFKTRIFAFLLMVGAPVVFTLFAAGELLTARRESAEEPAGRPGMAAA